MTFEDGMISCEALQIAFFALHADDEEARASLTEKAEYIMRKHRCLVQTFAPDARIRGCPCGFGKRGTTSILTPICSILRTDGPRGRIMLLTIYTF